VIEPELDRLHVLELAWVGDAVAWDSEPVCNDGKHAAQARRSELVSQTACAWLTGTARGARGSRTGRTPCLPGSIAPPGAARQRPNDGCCAREIRHLGYRVPLRRRSHAAMSRVASSPVSRATSHAAIATATVSATRRCIEAKSRSARTEPDSVAAALGRGVARASVGREAVRGPWPRPRLMNVYARVRRRAPLVDHHLSNRGHLRSARSRAVAWPVVLLD